jgi:hypothetical protein
MLRFESGGRAVLPDPLRPEGAAGQGGEGEGRAQDLAAALRVGAVNADHIGWALHAWRGFAVLKDLYYDSACADKAHPCYRLNLAKHDHPRCNPVDKSMRSIRSNDV